MRRRRATATWFAAVLSLTALSCGGGPSDVNLTGNWQVALTITACSNTAGLDGRACGYARIQAQQPFPIAITQTGATVMAVLENDPMPFSGTVTGGSVTLSRSKTFQDEMLYDGQGNILYGTLQQSEQYVLNTSKSEMSGAYSLTELASAAGGPLGTFTETATSRWTRQ